MTLKKRKAEFLQSPTLFASFSVFSGQHLSESLVGLKSKTSQHTYWLLLPGLLMAASLPSLAAEPKANLNPAAWGSDHVGRPVPEYITGDECLFCHRITIGPGWSRTRHQSTIRPIDL